MIIDYSAHNEWDFCPYSWYEKYILRRRKRWPKAQRSDALCLGSLVHAGLQVWQESHVIDIPASTVDEVTPDRETYNLALELVQGYAQTYPEEMWPLIRCEEPLLFPLSLTKEGDVLEGLAKIDTYFYVPEETYVETGLPGMTRVLTPGWWIHEYKTKSPYVSIPTYMQSWDMNLQASYQMLALTHHLDEQHMDKNLLGNGVQGVLVNVIEKPKRYIPKRKCKSCSELYEYATWLPTGTGKHACPVCGNQQVLDPLKQDTPHRPPFYFRLPVSRSSGELARDKALIIQRGQDMIRMAEQGFAGAVPTRKNCVDFKWNRACDYFGPHLNNTSTLEDDQYETPPDYRGLVEIET